MSNPNKAATIIFPMPVQGSAQAPHFKGEKLSAFLKQVQAHGRQAGITDDDELVDYLYDYSSSYVQSVIKWTPEFDVDEKNRTWAKAKALLKLQFRAKNDPPDATRRDLEQFCKKSYTDGTFSSTKDIDKYNREFTKLAAPLVKMKLITPEARNFYFVSGIPANLKEWFEQKTPEANRTTLTAPEVADSIETLYKKFDKKSIQYLPWEDSTSPKTTATSTSRVRFAEEEDEDSDSSQEPRPEKPTPTSTPTKKTPTTTSARNDSNPELEQLSRRMEELRISVLQMGNRLTNFHQGQAPQQSATPQHHHTGSSESIDVECFICGEKHDLPRSPRHGPMMPSLILEQLVYFDKVRRR